MNFKCITIGLTCSLMLTTVSKAQDYKSYRSNNRSYQKMQRGFVQVHQDERIDELLTRFKKLNNENEETDGYRIQIYSGQREKALKYAEDFKKRFKNIAVYTNYEQPNFKTKIGAYRNELHAKKALQDIKKYFPGAFIFKEKISYKDF